ncbi:MAG: hypothetical protein H6621_04920 [Halobacteriovoraceae bacterium]|nr:hypothetical protein [Halobacteriovoraceae bacterium]
MRKILLILLALSSCSQWETKKQKLDFQLFKENLRGVCLSAEGKGRIEVGREKYLFDYVSALKTDDHWAMGVNIPLRGEEDFQIERKASKFRFWGSFYQQIKQSFERSEKKNGKQKEFNKKNFNDFINFMAETLFDFSEIQNMKDEELKSYFKRCGSAPTKQCLFSHGNTPVLVGLVQSSIQYKKDKFVLEWTNKAKVFYKESYFSKMSIELFQGKRKFASVHLFPQKCQNVSN